MVANTNIKKDYIGVVSSADFSLMQLPLVNVMIQNGVATTKYVPPCSLFASVHIKGSEYVVPLNDEERKKIIFWEYLSNRLTNKPTNDGKVQLIKPTPGVGQIVQELPSSNTNFDCNFNNLRYFIDCFYDKYWGKLFSKNIKLRDPNRLI